MQKPMRLVVVATDSAVVGQACELADVLITPFQNTRCDTAELVADKEFLSSQGATAIWYKDEILRWSSVAQVRGVRPWVAINDQPPKARERVSSGGTNPQVDLAP